MLISFNPLKTQDVTLPVGCAFVVTHSLTEVNKAATSHFNTRVSECRLATQVSERERENSRINFTVIFEKILANAKGLDWRTIRKPYELQTALGMSILDLEQFAIDTLHEVPYTFDEIAGLLNVTVEELATTSLKGNFDQSKINTFVCIGRELLRCFFFFQTKNLNYANV